MARLLKAEGIGQSGGPASHDDVTQALSEKASLVNGKVPVEQLPDGIGQADLKFFHGDDAGAERPDSSLIIWVGSVEPTNGVAGDQWINDTDPLAPTYHVHLAGAWRQIAGGSGGPGTALAPVHGVTFEDLGGGIVRVSFSHPDEGDPQLFFDYQINNGQVMTTQETVIEVDTNQL